MKGKLKCVLFGLLGFLFGNANSQHIVNPIPELIKESGLILNLETFATVPIGPGYSSIRINMVRELPDGSGRMFAIDLNGFLHMIKADGERSLFIDFNAEYSKLKPQSGLGNGSSSVAIHPDFVNNGIFYTSHSEDANSQNSDFSPIEGGSQVQWVITRWVVSNINANTFSGTSSEIFRSEFPRNIHGMQDITFNPYAKSGNSDYGLLYVCLGDGGSSENGFFANVGTQQTYMGAILRIDPEGNNSVNGKYGVPTDNPFYNESNAVKELWAFGFRNPHRLSFEIREQDTLLFVGDIGHHKIEEINLVEKGGNYGWDRREGTFLHDINDPGRGILPLPDQDDKPYIYPVAQYDHGEGVAIALGHTVTDESDQSLFGQMFCGDILFGRVFHAPLDSLKQGRQYDLQEAKISIDGGPVTTFSSFIRGGNRVDLRFGRNNKGQLLMFTKYDGKIYKVSGNEVAVPDPIAQFSTDNISGHVPLQIKFNGALSMGDDLSYIWNFGDGETGSGSSITYTYSEPGVYEASLVVMSADQSSEKVTVEINAFANPKAKIVSNITEGILPLTVLFDGRTSEIDSRGSIGYTWDFGDGQDSLSLDAGFISHTYESIGVYEMIMTLSDGLDGIDADTLSILVKEEALSVSNDNIDAISIYPNPVKKILFVETNDKVTFEINTLDGKIKLKGSLEKGEHSIDVRAFDEGVYILRLKDESSHVTNKLILKQ